MSIHKQALGRVSHLGHLYDERTDSFLGFSSLKSSHAKEGEGDPLKGALKKTDIPFTDISYLITGSTSDKLHKLSVDPHLKISVLSGLISLNCSGQYLSDKKETSRSSSADLFYKMTTVFEEIDISKLSAEQINVNSLTRNATHVVVGIKWGANVIGSFEYE